MFASVALAAILSQSVITPPKAPADFLIVSAVDSVTYVGTTMPAVIIGGWAFECRSGLQPTLHVWGRVTVTFLNAAGDPWIAPRVWVQNTKRPDVRAAFPACESLGDRAGFNLYVQDAPPPGHYQVEVTWDTWNGRGIKASHTSKGTIDIPNAP